MSAPLAVVVGVVTEANYLSAAYWFLAASHRTPPCLTVPHTMIGANKMDWQDRISVDPKVLVGKPVIKGTRIAVEFVVDLLAHGWTTEQILDEYDHLTAEDIQACLAYASEVLKSERVYLVPS
jgi:uncharacterized protein (DUF433 family)